MENAVNGFRYTGIYPFDPSIIPDSAYDKSFVTDIPEGEKSGQETDAKIREDNVPPPVSGQSEEKAQNDNEDPEFCIESPTIITELALKKPAADELVTLNQIISIPKMTPKPKSGHKRKTRSGVVNSPEEIRNLEKQQKENEIPLDVKHKSKPQNSIKKAKGKASEIDTKRACIDHETVKTEETAKARTLQSKENKDKTDKNENNYCKYCNGYYFDENKYDEDWVKCGSTCGRWFHETCFLSFHTC